LQNLSLKMFSGQLLAIVSLLIIVCLGIITAFYYSNTHIIENYDELMLEESEKQQLNQIRTGVALIRQAEKSFYANPDKVSADKVSDYLQQTIQATNKLYQLELSLNEEDVENIKLIKDDLENYQKLFVQSLLTWNQQGYNREQGLSLKLKNIAYKEFRQRLSLYNTSQLYTLAYQLRWLEYEFYLYGNKYLKKISKLLQRFNQILSNNDYDPKLQQMLVQRLKNFEQTIQKFASKKNREKKHSELESISKSIVKLIDEHYIENFGFLLQTLLYYEMEYRKLEQKPKYVQGVKKTLQRFNYQVEHSNISAQEKEKIIQGLNDYQHIFEQVVFFDKEIKRLKQSISIVYERLLPQLQLAVQHEAETMQKIQNYTSQYNQKILLQNILITAIILIIVIILVILMVKRLSYKVGQIGLHLSLMAEGQLDKSLCLQSKDKTGELDSILHHVGQVAKNLSESFKSLKQQNQSLALISNKLSKYLSPQVYQSIFSGKETGKIQSKRKKLTIFFSDIVGFTDKTDMLEAEELSYILNDYLNQMSEIALRYGGTIDKYIGDAIMIFFGDPETKGEKEDSIACVSMALEMQQKIIKLQYKWEKEKGFNHNFQCRMGIATGYCTVGNFGSESRMDYTIIGGYVNLASRLEHISKPNQVLVSAETRLLANKHFNFNKVDTIKVKGIAHSVEIYEAISSNSKEILTKIDEPGVFVEVNQDIIAHSNKESLANRLESLAEQIRND